MRAFGRVFGNNGVLFLLTNCVCCSLSVHQDYEDFLSPGGGESNGILVTIAAHQSCIAGNVGGGAFEIPMYCIAQTF